MAAAGVDFDQWKALTVVALKLDYRTSSLGQSQFRREARQILGLLGQFIFYTVVGAAMAFLVWVSADLFFVSTVAMTYTMFVVGTAVLIDHNSALTSPVDYVILGFRPVTLAHLLRGPADERPGVHDADYHGRGMVADRRTVSPTWRGGWRSRRAGLLPLFDQHGAGDSAGLLVGAGCARTAGCQAGAVVSSARHELSRVRRLLLRGRPDFTERRDIVDVAEDALVAASTRRRGSAPIWNWPPASWVRARSCPPPRRSSRWSRWRRCWAVGLSLEYSERLSGAHDGSCAAQDRATATTRRRLRRWFQNRGSARSGACSCGASFGTISGSGWASSPSCR